MNYAYLSKQGDYYVIAHDYNDAFDKWFIYCTAENENIAQILVDALNAKGRTNND